MKFKVEKKDKKMVATFFGLPDNQDLVQVSADFKAFLDDGTEMLILDLKELDSVNSQFLGLLASVSHHYGFCNKKFIVANPPDFLMEVLNQSGIATRLRIIHT
ncbi:MAG: hypothetical protein JKX97_00960 [Candidatus Lindowbacteria bacterium]|nr:hypothetical protein [Candidatus Lindowbacteria bacterium]